MATLTNEQQKDIVVFIRKYAVKGIVKSMLSLLFFCVVILVTMAVTGIQKNLILLSGYLSIIFYVFFGGMDTIHYVGRLVEAYNLSKMNFCMDYVEANGFKMSYNIFRIGHRNNILADFRFNNNRYIRTILEGKYMINNDHRLAIFYGCRADKKVGKIYAYPMKYFDKVL